MPAQQRTRAGSGSENQGGERRDNREGGRRGGDRPGGREGDGGPRFVAERHPGRDAGRDGERGAADVDRSGEARRHLRPGREGRRARLRRDREAGPSDLARAEPVAVTKHGRAVVVVIAVEEYERLKDIEMDNENV